MNMLLDGIKTDSILISAHEVKHLHVCVCVYTQSRGEGRRGHRGALPWTLAWRWGGALEKNKDV